MPQFSRFASKNSLTVGRRKRIIAAIIASGFQGTVSGYTSNERSGTAINHIDKFPFATDSNASVVGDLSQKRGAASGQSSDTHGYTSGGLRPPPPSTTTNVSTIDKFPFASDGNAAYIGSLTIGLSSSAGQSSSENGYVSGGQKQPNNSNDVRLEIQKFPFASDASASNIGNLTVRRYVAAGQSSNDNGYMSGGRESIPLGPIRSTIDKFPFASDANATGVGNLSQARQSISGQSSDVSGYTSGGFAPPLVNTIDKFSFASDGNASDVGDLTGAKNGTIGQSSTSSGYVSGYGTGIEKFSFASDSNGTSVGNLTAQPGGGAGQQV